MKRRTILQVLASFVAALPARVRLYGQAVLTSTDEARIRAIAEVVLPGEIGGDARARTVAGFLRWLRDYRAGADTDHGYGFTRLRKTPSSPATKYAAQLDALDARAGAGGFASLSPDERRAIVEGAIAAAKVERLPARPDGGHVATDLMAYYFNSVEAHDLAYRAAIGRDTCRGLEGSENRPAPLGGTRDHLQQEIDHAAL
jgi:hypothetical protein